MSHPRLRPLAFGEILDGAFQLYRRHFSALFLAALVPFVPLIAVYFLMAVAVSVVGTTAGLIVMMAGGLLTVPLVVVGFFVSMAALTYMTARAYTGEPVSTEAGIRYGLSRFWPLVGALLLAGFLIMLGTLLFIVPGIILYCMFFAVIPAVVIEKQGPTDALRRSRELARGALGRIFALLLVAGIIAALPGMVLGMGSALAFGAGVDDYTLPWLTFAVQSGQQLLTALTWPFSFAATVLLYYDRRVRAEALDVEMAAEGLPTPA
jgi:hypothetical protein